MDQTTRTVNQEPKKVNENELSTKKILFGKIQGEWSLDMLLLNLDKISVLLVTVFSL